MISVYVANLQLYGEGRLEGEWLVLPCSTDRMEVVLHNIGVNKPFKEYFIDECSSKLLFVADVIHEFSSLISLNALADRLSQLTGVELEKLEAIHEAKQFSEPSQVLDTSNELNRWTVYPAVHEYDELGKLYYEERGAIEIPENLLPYFDFFKYGKEIVRKSLYCRFTTYGFVVHK